MDFEYHHNGVREDNGSLPAPVCLVAKEIKSGHLIRQWQSDFGACPPYSLGPESLFVSYNAPAELTCHIVLGWAMPSRVLDLYIENKAQWNGIKTGFDNKLLSALAMRGLPHLDVTEKQSMIDLILTAGPWTPEDRNAILDYCQSDVVALERLLPAMIPTIDLPRALLRGRYMTAVARMQYTGTPIDTTTLGLLKTHWEGIQDDLIRGIDAQYGVFEGRTFKTWRWADWLEKNNIPWERLGSGALDLSDEVFRQMAKSYPQVSPMRELRHALSQLRLSSLEVGPDGRNRTSIFPFASNTGRNQPSNSKYIFGPSVWLRGLIKPNSGKAVAYIDYAQQEIGVAAALSKDKAMMQAYNSGDPYLEFAKQAGAIPSDGIRKDYESVRSLFKQCVLAVNYGMGERSLAYRIGKPVIVARELLRMHRETYSKFWEWSDRAVTYGMLSNRLHTVFNWQIRVTAKESKYRPDGSLEVNDRSLRNFPVQANSAEVFRLACCMITEQGIDLCAPLHDAVLIEADESRIDEAVAAAQAAMAEASDIVLGGFRLNSEAKIVRYPDRYMDEDRGQVMWDTVMKLVDERDTPTLCRVRTQHAA